MGKCYILLISSIALYTSQHTFSEEPRAKVHLLSLACLKIQSSPHLRRAALVMRERDCTIVEVHKSVFAAIECRIHTGMIHALFEEEAAGHGACFAIDAVFPKVCDWGCEVSLHQVIPGAKDAIPGIRCKFCNFIRPPS